MARAGGLRHRRLQITDLRMEMGDGDVMDICQWLVHDTHE